MNQQRQSPSAYLTDRRFMGNLLTVLAGAFFYIVCMLLPLVGQAGRTTEHYGQNFATFAAVLLLAAISAVGGLVLKLKTRKLDQGPFPFVSAGLALVYGSLLVCLILGRVHI